MPAFTDTEGATLVKRTLDAEGPILQMAMDIRSCRVSGSSTMLLSVCAEQVGDADRVMQHGLVAMHNLETPRWRSSPHVREYADYHAVSVIIGVCRL